MFSSSLCVETSLEQVILLGIPAVDKLFVDSRGLINGLEEFEFKRVEDNNVGGCSFNVTFNHRAKIKVPAGIMQVMHSKRITECRLYL